MKFLTENNSLSEKNPFIHGYIFYFRSVLNQPFKEIILFLFIKHVPVILFSHKFKIYLGMLYVRSSFSHVHLFFLKSVGWEEPRMKRMVGREKCIFLKIIRSRRLIFLPGLSLAGKRFLLRSVHITPFFFSLFFFFFPAPALLRSANESSFSIWFPWCEEPSLPFLSLNRVERYTRFFSPTSPALVDLWNFSPGDIYSYKKRVSFFFPEFFFWIII